MAKVTIGSEPVTIGEFSARKSLRVMKIIRQISQGWPEIGKAIAAFRREYERENRVELDRATAQYQFGAEQPTIVGQRDGEVLYERDSAGQIVYRPSRLAHMTEQDWEQSGQRLSLPQSPSELEEAFAVFPLAFDLAEDLMLQLCALCVLGNEELGRAARDGGADAVTELLQRRGEELLDQAMGDQLLELVVAASEVVEQQFASKLRDLGERVGNVRKLIGWEKPVSTPTAPEPQTTETETGTSTTQTPPRPDSSTALPQPTDGTSEPPSTEPAGDSSLSSAAA